LRRFDRRHALSTFHLLRSFSAWRRRHAMHIACAG
jgi:hypothetical protein